MLLLDDELVKAMNMSQNEIKLEFAIWLYEKDKVSLRKAAKLAGLDWLNLSKILCDRNIPTVKMTDEDLETEINTVKHLLK